MNRYKFINDLKLKIYAFEKVKVGTWWNYPKHSSPFARIFVILEGEQNALVVGELRQLLQCATDDVPPLTAPLRERIGKRARVSIVAQSVADHDPRPGGEDLTDG